MFLFTLYRIIKFAIQGFWRNFWLSIATITVMALALISINFLLILNITANSALDVIQNKIDISIYFKNDTDENIILEAKNMLSGLTQVESVGYITKDEALDMFRQKHKNDRLILEALEETGGNPLEDTLKIRSKNISDYQAILDIIDNSKYNQYILDKNFDDHKDFINRVHSISGIINAIGIIVIFIFIMISILIVFNTIKLNIYAHKEEISVMKYVGANNFFITSPFILEGVAYSIISFIISSIVIYFSIGFVHPYIMNYFQGEINIQSYLMGNLILIFGTELLISIILTVLASAVAIRRYLRV